MNLNCCCCCCWQTSATTTTTYFSVVFLLLLITGQWASYTYYRLPTAIKPLIYNLNIITYLEPHNLNFRGFVNILLSVQEDTNNITLHVSNLSVNQERILLRRHDEAEFKPCARSVNQIPYHDYFIIGSCRPLYKGEYYYLKLLFDGELNDQLRGYYRSSYIVRGTKERRWLSMTQFEPVAARTAFPCFDEPGFKARFQIRLGHHRNQVALSNMPLIAKYDMIGQPEYIWSIFEESVPMSTYLVAYSVNDFTHKMTNNHMRVTFRTWSRSEVIDQADYANYIGPAVLKYYETIFGIAFPLRKLDQIAVPDFAAGAMENWGLVAYRETALLYAPNVSSEANKQHIASIIAHELAHQWFGNLVTMKWWSDLWLNEGFATYMASLGVNHLYPQWDALNEESLSNLLMIFRRDAQLSTHPVSQAIDNTYLITDRFDTISYKKGSAILRMLHHILGSEAFFNGIRNYLHAKQYSNAEQDDLWKAFTTQGHVYGLLNFGANIKTIMDSWTLQEGFPLVRVERNYTTGWTTITQTRFIENITEIKFQRSNVCWWIPLTYITSSMITSFSSISSKAPVAMVWLKCHPNGFPERLNLQPMINEREWILMNVNFAGVFRIMYDSHNLEMLISTLNSPRYRDIPVMNRAQLIDDNAWLSWFGYQSYIPLFNLLEYLIREETYLPWRASLESLTNVNRLLRRFPQSYEEFQNFMLRLLTPIYYHLHGLNATNTGSTSHTYIQHKSLITSWACRLEMTDCVNVSLNYFQRWKQYQRPDENNFIPVDLRTTVYCTAIRHGSKDDWNFLFKRYEESMVSAERQTILFALTCTKKIYTLKKYLQFMFDPVYGMSMEESRHAFTSVARSLFGYRLALNYFLKNIDHLNIFYKSNVKELALLVQALSSQIIEKNDLSKLQDLLQRKAMYFHNMEKTILSSLETIYFNIDWVLRNVKLLRKQIQEQNALVTMRTWDTYFRDCKVGKG